MTKGRACRAGALRHCAVPSSAPPPRDCTAAAPSWLPVAAAPSPPDAPVAAVRASPIRRPLVASRRRPVASRRRPLVAAHRRPLVARRRLAAPSPPDQPAPDSSRRQQFPARRRPLVSADPPVCAALPHFVPVCARPLGGRGHHLASRLRRVRRRPEDSFLDIFELGEESEIQVPESHTTVVKTAISNYRKAIDEGLLLKLPFTTIFEYLQRQRNLQMETAAAVASSGSGLRCLLNPAPKQQQGGTPLMGFATARRPCAVTCRGSLLHPRACVYAAVTDNGAGDAGVRRKRLAVFVSGRGSNFRSIHEAALGGRVNGDVVALVTDKPGCGGAEHARCNGIPVVVFPKSKSAPALEGVSTAQLLNVLRDLKVDLVLLAGYLKLIPLELIQAYPRSILNIHPSLLPAFGGKGYYGLKVHKAVIASGARYSGPTVHFVDQQYDTGRTLAQRVVHVLANDTPEQLAARVLHEEHQLYVEAVAALCEDRILWREDGVPIIRSRTNPDEYT